MSDQHTQTTTAAFAQALVDVGVQLATILHQMSTHPSPQDADPPVDVLHRLLANTFARKLGSDPDALPQASTVLSTAAGVIEENIFLVPPSPRPPRRRDGGRRRRRRSRR